MGLNQRDLYIEKHFVGTRRWLVKAYKILQPVRSVKGIREYWIQNFKILFNANVIHCEIFSSIAEYVKILLDKINSVLWTIEMFVKRLVFSSFMETVMCVNIKNTFCLNLLVEIINYLSVKILFHHLHKLLCIVKNIRCAWLPHLTTNRSSFKNITSFKKFYYVQLLSTEPQFLQHWHTAPHSAIGMVCCFYAAKVL